MKNIKIEYRYKPSPGFILVCLVHILAVFLFSWGLKTPDLDNLWFIINKLNTGKIQSLSSDDIVSMFQTLQNHPDFVDKLVGNDRIHILSPHTENYLETKKTYIIRGKDKSSTAFHLSLQGAENIWPVNASINIFQKKNKNKIFDIIANKSGRHKIILKPTDTTQLIELNLVISGISRPRHLKLDTAITVMVKFEKTND